MFGYERGGGVGGEETLEKYLNLDGGGGGGGGVLQ